jgi:hypothetical protein
MTYRINGSRSAKRSRTGIVLALILAFFVVIGGALYGFVNRGPMTAANIERITPATTVGQGATRFTPANPTPPPARQ